MLTETGQGYYTIYFSIINNIFCLLVCFAAHLPLGCAHSSSDIAGNDAQLSEAAIAVNDSLYGNLVYRPYDRIPPPPPITAIADRKTLFFKPRRAQSFYSSSLSCFLLRFCFSSVRCGSLFYFSRFLSLAYRD